ncbi:MAG: STAS domain-containing protein [Spirochaetaceae bacterium]
METNPFVEARSEGAGVILYPTSALEQYNVDTIWRFITEEIESGKPEWVVLDCSAVPFVDSRGIGLCIRLDQRLREQNRRLYITEINKHLQDAFRYTNLFTHFTIIESLSEAIRQAESSSTRNIE